jgi:hypothetical protein
MFIIEDFELPKTTKVIQMMLVAKTLLPRSFLLEMFHLKDVATQCVSAKGCCYQRTTNVTLKMLLLKDIIAHPRCCCMKVVAKLGHCYQKCYYNFFLQNDCYQTR